MGVGYWQDVRKQTNQTPQFLLWLSLTDVGATLSFCRITPELRRLSRFRLIFFKPSRIVTHFSKFIQALSPSSWKSTDSTPRQSDNLKMERREFFSSKDLDKIFSALTYLFYVKFECLLSVLRCCKESTIHLVIPLIQNLMIDLNQKSII